MKTWHVTWGQKIAVIIGLLVGVCLDQYYENYFLEQNNVVQTDRGLTAPNQLPSPVIDDIYDGDTIYVTFPGIPDILGKHVRIRLLGIDTPELKSKNELEKKHAVKAKERLIELVGKNNIRLGEIKRDKFFGLDCNVYVGETNLSQQLIKEGLGREYWGDKKEEWNFTE